MNSFKIIKNEVIKLFIAISLLFVMAGRISYWQAYGYLLINLIFFVVIVIMSIKNKDFANLLKGNAFSKQYKYEWDRFFWILYWPIYFGIFIVAGFDAGRYGWTRISGNVLYILAYLVYIGSYSFILWAMRINKYFSGTAHVQKEYQLIKEGPYQLVRHPGYLGAIFLLVSSAIILGSLWALIAAIIGAFLLVIRAGLEDSILCDNLAGYLDYTKKIRYRLIPGVW